MVFTSIEFIYLFLPAFFIGYFCFSKNLRNVYLLLFSILFYYIGEGDRTWILIVSILVNYIFGVAIYKNKSYSKVLLFIGVAINLSILGYFKYIGFFTSNFSKLLSSLDIEQLIPVIHVALPLGISFFIFQGISYLVDVYRGDVVVSKNPLEVATYITMFPQLIAGPIVRYTQVADDMKCRDARLSQISGGILRFSLGFAKKVLLADTFAIVADGIMGSPDLNTLSALDAWVGIIAYSLQIFFDFSAYSDMAIGLGMILGFKFPENFNYPYVSKSITEFWRRWHISLSTWFRDYVYIPLGGNRVSSTRNYINLYIVFFLTGFWHGSSWAFIFWGLWHGSFIVIEKRCNGLNIKIPNILKHLYVLVVVLIGWVFFRLESFSSSVAYIKAMFGYNELELMPNYSYQYFTAFFITTFVFGVISSTSIFKMCSSYIQKYKYGVPLVALVIISLLVVAMMKVMIGSYSPFLYFRF